MKNKKQSKDKTIKKVKRSKKPYVVTVLVIVVLVVLVFFYIKNNKKTNISQTNNTNDNLENMIDNNKLDTQMFPELLWPPKVVKESYSNSTKFIKARLEMCLKYGPKVNLPLEDNIYSNVFLRNYLDRNYLDNALLKIENGDRDLKESNKHFKIIVLGDTHINPLDFENSSALEVANRQRSHINYINNSSVSLALAEGIDFKVSLDNLQKSMNFNCQKLRLPSLTKEQLIESLDYEKVWWNYYLLNPKNGLTIVGTDYVPINDLVMALTMQIRAIENPNDKMRVMLVDTLHWINYELREYIIIFKAVEQMTLHKRSDCVLVIGKSHLKTLGEKCQKLSIEYITN